MVDTPTTSTAPAGGAKGFLASRNGRLMLGGVALVVVMAIVGIVVYYFLSEGASNQSALVAGGSGAGAVVASETPEPADAEPLSSTFEFRDVFAPSLSISDLTSITSGPGSSESSSTGSRYPADTLVLLSVASGEDSRTAEMVWDNTRYTLSEGDVIGDTPWQVVSIFDDSVVMLYGDERIRLWVGQGVSK